MAQTKFLRPKHYIFIIVSIIYLIFCFFDYSFASSSDNSEDDYYTSLDYYTCYNLKGSNNFVSFGLYSVGEQEYLQDWSIKRTWTIDSTPVSIYSIVNKFNTNDYVFSVQPIIENENTGNVNTFKIYDMHCYLYYRPEHILTEGKIKCTFVNYLPIELMDTHHVRLQGKLRTTGEWVTLKQLNIDTNNAAMYLEWNGSDSNPSFQYSEYRINVLYWNFSNNGYTLISNGVASSEQKLCSIDFVGVETNDWEKKVDELVDIQNSIFNEIDGIGDLIINLPDIILDGIYELFVPDDLDDILEENLSEITDKLGILYLPFDFVIHELNILLTYNADSTIIFPSLSVMGQKLNDNTTFDLSTVGDIRVASTDDWNGVYIIDIVHFFTTIMIIYSLVIMAIDVLNLLFSNRAQSLYDDITVKGDDEDDN